MTATLNSGMVWACRVIIIRTPISGKHDLNGMRDLWSCGQDLTRRSQAREAERGLRLRPSYFCFVPSRETSPASSTPSRAPAITASIMPRVFASLVYALAAAFFGCFLFWPIFQALQG